MKLRSDDDLSAPTEINVIGQTVDDATREVEKFVDRAFLAGLPRFVAPAIRGLALDHVFTSALFYAAALLLAPANPALAASTVSGELGANTVWEGQVDVSGSVQVPAGVDTTVSCRNPYGSPRRDCSASPARLAV